MAPSLVLCLMLGCSSGSQNAPDPPEISPSSAASQALADYDSNKDGALDAQELERCPALKSAVAKIDKNKDGRLSAGEIEERLAAFKTRGMLTEAVVEVTLNGTALSGATVTFTPEKFMGPALKAGSGITEDDGRAAVNVEGFAGVPLGFYRIEVSKKNAQGQELVPARYNTSTILGREVYPEGDGRGEEATIFLKLTK